MPVEAGVSRKRPQPLPVLWLGTLLLSALSLLTQPAGAQLPAGVIGAAPRQEQPQVSPTATPGCGVAWRNVASPNVGTGYNSFNGIAAVSTNDVWAVGHFSDAPGHHQTLVEHWDGAQWSIVPSPNVGPNSNYLEGVAAVAANDVWAVGYYVTLGYYQTLVLHWNGAQWSVVPSPNTSQYTNQLKAISIVSANDIWAVGTYKEAGRPQTLALHWDGTQWSIVSSPNPSNESQFEGVAAVSANDVWAVGNYYNGSYRGYVTLVEHWDGVQWSVVQAPSVGRLNGITAISTNDVWAVGSYILHWDGSSWEVVTGLGGRTLNGVAAVSANDVWAVGGEPDTLIMHWDGSQWSRVPSPSPGRGNDYLNGVTAASANNIWVAGSYSNGGADKTLVQRYSYACPTPTVTPTPIPACEPAWRVTDSPNMWAFGGSLYGVAAVSANDVWAVGRRRYDDFIVENNWETLIERWDGSQWNIVPNPRGFYVTAVLNAIAIASANDIWAVGNHGRIPGIGERIIMHWDGTVWSLASAPSVGALFGVAVVSASDVWAVGDGIMHWDGTVWSIVESPVTATLRGVAAISANDVWAAGYYTNAGAKQALTMHWDGSAWSVVPSPNPGTVGSALHGIAAVAGGDIWSVGEFSTGGSPTETLTMHWDGTEWATVPSPNYGSSDNSLNGIAAASANNIWAVGASGDDTLALRWDGAQWSRASSPNPEHIENTLRGVVAISANDVWTIGTSGSTYYTDEDVALVEHWDGAQLNEIPEVSTRSVSGNIMSVSAVSHNDVWAVGSHNHDGVKGMIQHWDGTRWSLFPFPNFHLGHSYYFYGIDAVSANDVWVVGYSQSNYFGDNSKILHWNGTQWSVSNPPNTGVDSYLYGVEAISANDVWAVGNLSDLSCCWTFRVHWDGTRWSEIQPSLLKHHSLYGVAASATDDVWAVGALAGQTVTDHWDGTQWSIVPSPNVGTGANRLNGVAAISPSDAWAVGQYTDGLRNHALILRWDGAQWSLAPNPIPGDEDSVLKGVTAVSANDVWAVGSYAGESLVLRWDGAQWSRVPSPNAGSGINTLKGVAALSAGDVWAGGESDGLSLIERYNDPCLVKLVGHTTWQGRPSQPNTLQRIPVTLTLKSGLTEINYPAEVTNAGGVFTVSVDTLPSGTYNWRVKHPKFLANSGTANLGMRNAECGMPLNYSAFRIPHSAFVEMGLMKVGDANDDNMLDVGDYNILRAAFGEVCGDPEYADGADFTGDCAVNVSDYNLLRGNFGLGGAPPISPGTP